MVYVLKKGRILSKAVSLDARRRVAESILEITNRANWYDRTNHRESS